MRAINIVTNDNRTRSFQLPKGLDRCMVVAALKAINRGEDFNGLTAREAAFVADLMEQVRPANNGGAAP